MHVVVALMHVVHVIGLVAVMLVVVAFVHVVTGLCHGEPFGIARPRGPAELRAD